MRNFFKRTKPVVIPVTIVDSMSPELMQAYVNVFGTPAN